MDCVGYARAFACVPTADAVGVGLTCGLAALTSSFCLIKSRESGAVLPSLGGVLGSVLRVMAPSNWQAALYSVSTLGLAGE